MTRFKNYVNSLTREPLIYSGRDIMQMPVTEALDNEYSILAQNRQIGIPSVEELSASSNVVWVDAYTRADGVEVRGHWRSKPEGGLITGGASDMKTEGGFVPRQSPILLDENPNEEMRKRKEKYDFLIVPNAQFVMRLGDTNQSQEDSNGVKDKYSKIADEAVDKYYGLPSGTWANFKKEGFDSDNNMDLFEEVLGFGFEKVLNEILPMSSNSVIDGMHDLEAARKNPEAKIYNNTSEIQDGYIKRQLEKFGEKPNDAVVEYSDKSEESRKFSKAPEMEEYVKNNKEQILNNTAVPEVIEFSKNSGGGALDRYFYLQHATILKPQIDKEGVFTGILADIYDFKEREKTLKNMPNNWGYVQQEKGNLKNYAILIHIKKKI